MVAPPPLHHVHYVTSNTAGLMGSFTVRRAHRWGPQPPALGPLALCCHCRLLAPPLCLVVFRINVSSPNPNSLIVFCLFALMIERMMGNFSLTDCKITKLYPVGRTIENMYWCTEMQPLVAALSFMLNFCTYMDTGSRITIDANWCSEPAGNIEK